MAGVRGRCFRLGTAAELPCLPPPMSSGNPWSDSRQLIRLSADGAFGEGGRAVRQG